MYLVAIVLPVRWRGPLFFARLRRPVTRLRLDPPRAICARAGRADGREIGQLIIGTLLFGLGILPVLVRQWSGRSTATTPAAAYRAERIACLVTGLSWAPVGVLLGVLSASGAAVLPAVVAAHAGVAVALGALLSGPYPLLKLSEPVLSADWGDRVRFLPLLEDAADRGVLRRASGGYEFRDEALLAQLRASGQAARPGPGEAAGRRLARKGVAPPS